MFDSVLNAPTLSLTVNIPFQNPFQVISITFPFQAIISLLPSVAFLYPMKKQHRAVMG